MSQLRNLITDVPGVRVGHADDARIGYTPARVWGVPTTALWAHRIGDQRGEARLRYWDGVAWTDHTAV